MEAGKQLVYEDMCRVAINQAIKNGFIDKKDRKNLMYDYRDSPLKVDEAKRDVVGGNKLTAVIEKLERSVSW